MTDAYATLAARGVHHDPQAFELVRGPRGGVIGKLNAPGAQAIPRNTADLVTYALQGVVTHGTGTAAVLRPARRGQDRHRGELHGRVVLRLRPAARRVRLDRLSEGARSRSTDVEGVAARSSAARCPRRSGTASCRRPSRSCRCRTSHTRSSRATRCRSPYSYVPTYTYARRRRPTTETTHAGTAHAAADDDLDPGAAAGTARRRRPPPPAATTREPAVAAHARGTRSTGSTTSSATAIERAVCAHHRRRLARRGHRAASTAPAGRLGERRRRSRREPATRVELLVDGGRGAAADRRATSPLRESHVHVAGLVLHAVVPAWATDGPTLRELLADGGRRGATCACSRGPERRCRSSIPTAPRCGRCATSSSRGHADRDGSSTRRSGRCTATTRSSSSSTTASRTSAGST